MPIVFEHMSWSPEERAVRARIGARCAALRAEAEAARQVRAAGERRSIVVSPGADPGAGRGRARDVPARVVAPPPAAPSLFRALRPGDTIVKLTTPTPVPTSTTPTPRPILHGPEPVAAILARRAVAVDRMARWTRGDDSSASAAPSANPAAAGVLAARAARPAEPQPLALADLFARRRAVVQAARPYMMRED